MKLLTNRKTIKYTLPIGLVVGVLTAIKIAEGCPFWFAMIIAILWGLGNFIVIQGVVDVVTGVYRKKK